MPVTNISSTHELLRKDHYKINVTWNAQEYQPDRYNVTINMFSNGSAVSQSVPGVRKLRLFIYFFRCIISNILISIIIFIRFIDAESC